MKIVGALFGFLILAVVFVVWFRAYRSIKGDESLLLSKASAKGTKQTNSLDEFIAQYKRGEVTLDKSPIAADNAAGSATDKGTTKNAAIEARTPAAPALGASTTPPTDSAGTAAPLKRDAFVSGATKLVYLACKAGLRDHHVFAHVQLSALAAAGTMDPLLATSGVDLVICNAALSAVAAVDVVDSATAPANPAKSDYLKGLGIRYLRLSVKSVPRPNEWHALLYKM